MLNWNQFCSKWVDRIFFQIGLFETAWIGMYLSWKTFELNSECGNVFMHIFVMLLLLLFWCPDTVSNLEVSTFKSHSWKCALVLARNDIFEMLIKSDVPYTVFLFFYVFLHCKYSRIVFFFSFVNCWSQNAHSITEYYWRVEPIAFVWFVPKRIFSFDYFGN